MKREFLIERQGRSFAMYAGLLDEAHQQGLKSIKTQMIQIPTPENGHVAICVAEVETERGVFTGIGDATPQNVARLVAPHFIRMAETRAKARALRDAINVGTTAIEELADDEVGPAHSPEEPRDQRPIELGSFAGRGERQASASRPAPAPASAGPRPPAANGERGDLATPAQVRAIYLIGRDQHGLGDAEIDERSVALFGSAPAELTKKQASHLITSLKTGAQSAAS